MSSADEHIRNVVRDELRKILDAGLMYTAPAPAPKPQPPTPQPTPQAPIKQAFLSPKLDEILKYERAADGVVWAKVKNHLTPEEFKEVAKEIETICKAKYVPSKGWPLQ